MLVLFGLRFLGLLQANKYAFEHLSFFLESTHLIRGTGIFHLNVLSLGPNLSLMLSCKLLGALYLTL